MKAFRVVAVLALALSSSAWASEPSPEDLAFFESKVRPILVEHCYSCHSAGAKKLRGNLFLDTREGWKKGGDTGPALVPGDPEASLLIEAVRYADPAVQMPPRGKLPDQTIAVLTDWVKRGRPTPAPDRRRRLPSRSTSRPARNTGRSSR